MDWEKEDDDGGWTLIPPAASRRRPAAAAASGKRRRVAAKHPASRGSARASRDDAPRASRVEDGLSLFFPVEDDHEALEHLPTDMVTVGSDCAGLLTEGLALELLGVPHKHVFVSEKDQAVRHLIYQVYGKNLKVYKDCGARDMASVPRVHLYVFGFPCQPFSPAGKGRGLGDPRGQVLTHCLEYVRQKRPVMVLAENSALFASKRPLPKRCGVT